MWDIGGPASLIALDEDVVDELDDRGFLGLVHLVVAGGGRGAHRSRPWKPAAPGGGHFSQGVAADGRSWRG